MNALLRIAAWILAVALVVAPGAAVLNGWVAGERFPMRQLVVTGEFRQVSDARVRSVVMPYVRHGFFAVDLDAMRAALAELPWVRSVEVRKRWPDRLEVALVDYKPLARWGEGRMLSENGEIFPAPRGHVSRLPMFVGPDDRAAELMAFHSLAKPMFLGLGLQLREGTHRLGRGQGARLVVGMHEVPDRSTKGVFGGPSQERRPAGADMHGLAAAHGHENIVAIVEQPVGRFELGGIVVAKYLEHEYPARPSVIWQRD